MGWFFGFLLGSILSSNSCKKEIIKESSIESDIEEIRNHVESTEKLMVYTGVIFILIGLIYLIL